MSMDETSGVKWRMESTAESLPFSLTAPGVTGAAEAVAASVVSVLSKIGARLPFDDELFDADEHETRTPADTTSAERAIQTRYFLVSLPKLSINSAIFADKVGKNQKIVPKTAWNAYFR